MYCGHPASVWLGLEMRSLWRWVKLAVFVGPYGCNLKACVFEHLVLTALFGQLVEPLWGVWLVEAGWPLRVMGQLSSSHVFLGLDALEKVLPHMAITTFIS